MAALSSPSRDARVEIQSTSTGSQRQVSDPPRGRRAGVRESEVGSRQKASAHVPGAAGLRQIRTLRTETIEQRVRLLSRHERNLLSRIEDERVILGRLEKRGAEARDVLLPVNEQLLAHHRRLVRSIAAQ